MKVLWLDTETTGLDPAANRITEVAARYENYDAVGAGAVRDFHRYVCHEQYPADYMAPGGAGELTGLTPEILAERGVPERVAYGDLQAFLNQCVDRFNKRDKMVLAGYCVHFDDGFLRALFERYDNKYYGSYFWKKSLDVASIVMHAVLRKRIPPLDDYKLKTVCNHLGVENDAHGAVSDALATRAVYHKLVWPEMAQEPASEPAPAQAQDDEPISLFDEGEQ